MPEPDGVEPGSGRDALARLRLEHETWLAVERGVAGNTLSAYRRDLAGYERFLRRQDLFDPASVTEDVVAAFVAELEAARDEEGRPRYRPASVARALVAVRSFHAFCAEEGHATGDPAAVVGARPVPRGIPKALTEEEVEGLLGAVRGDDPSARRDRAILEVLYGCGLRISELTGLDVASVDLEDRFLRAFGKGSKERLVPLGAGAARAIGAWLPARSEWLRGRRRSESGRRRDPGALFLNARGGRLGRQGAWLVVRRHGTAAGLADRLSPHVLRHSCATHMVERGADLRVVQELLGHASVSTTQIYTKVTQARLRAVYEAAHPRARASAGRAAAPSGDAGRGGQSGLR